jgi:caffeic acid 3-O-methyltransferase
VLKSEEPFTNAHGMNQFEYMKSHPEFLATFKNSFMDHAAKLVPLLLSKYHGFEGVWRLVDVGGNSGVILAGIVQKYPHIHAINFDLPEVVATNTSFPGKP